ncbi:phosphopantetheine-binding protein [Streptomyces sp. cg35]|uniref:phosphopantetheine-binding protein n=1 Tax=Streptomyces sp. cg35 TaxID=3421650 RepID=UPI003D18471D
MSAESPVASAITEVLTEKFEVDPAAVRPGATLESLDLDSLALAELALTLQERLGVPVDGDEAAKHVTVAGLAAVLSAKCTVAEAR